jgi:hypothetical protein
VHTLWQPTAHPAVATGGRTAFEKLPASKRLKMVAAARIECEAAKKEAKGSNVKKSGGRGSDTHDWEQGARGHLVCAACRHCGAWEAGNGINYD